MGSARPDLLQEPGGAGCRARHRPEVVSRSGGLPQGGAGALAADVAALRSADYRGGPARRAHGRKLTNYAGRRAGRSPRTILTTKLRSKHMKKTLLLAT